MTDFSQFTRRKFLTTAGASAAAAVFLKGCAGNPPSSTPTAQTSPTAAPAVNMGAGESPEVTTVKLGFLPIFESAPLIIAKE